MTKVSDELRSFITKEMSELLVTAREVFSPGEFAKMVIDEEINNDILIAIAFRVGEILEARTTENK